MTRKIGKPSTVSPTRSRRKAGAVSRRRASSLSAKEHAVFRVLWKLHFPSGAYYECQRMKAFTEVVRIMRAGVNRPAGA